MLFFDRGWWDEQKQPFQPDYPILRQSGSEGFKNNRWHFTSAFLCKAAADLARPRFLCQCFNSRVITLSSSGSERTGGKNEQLHQHNYFWLCLKRPHHDGCASWLSIRDDICSRLHFSRVEWQGWKAATLTYSIKCPIYLPPAVSCVSLVRVYLVTCWQQHCA